MPILTAVYKVTAIYVQYILLKAVTCVQKIRHNEGYIERLVYYKTNCFSLKTPPSAIFSIHTSML